MKKLALALVLIMAFSITACGSESNGPTASLKATATPTPIWMGYSTTSTPTPEAATPTSKPVTNVNSPYTTVDVDLSVLSANMVYAQVYSMVTAPNDYLGQVMRVKGIYNKIFDESTQQYYDVILITDALACCSQGLEFRLTADYTYPDDYPEQGTEVTIVGTFGTYVEGSYLYLVIDNSILEG